MITLECIECGCKFAVEKMDRCYCPRCGQRLVLVEKK